MSKSFGVACPACEKVLKIKNRELIGKRIICPKCEYAFRIEADKVQKVVSKSPSDHSSSARPKRSQKPKGKTRKPTPEPVAQNDNPDDEWLSALSEAEETGSSLQDNEFGGASLPPVKRGHKAPKPKKKKREIQEPIPGDSYCQSNPAGGGGLFGLGLFGGLVGGLIAGIIGALIWGGSDLRLWL